MIKLIIQKKTISKSIKNTSKNKLSIQFSLDGFSFCIANQENQISDVSDYTFNEEVTTPENLLKEIEAIFKKDSKLQQDFSSILAIHQNNLSTLVPNSLFDEKSIKNYLNSNVKILETDYITFDNLSNIKAKNVYIPYVNINNYLFQNFGAFEFKHHTTVLIDKVLDYSITNTSKEMYVAVSKKTMNIIVIENKKLLLSNSFSFQNKEDFIYYILFTAEQLNFNTEENRLVFIGDIEKESEIYTNTYLYIRNIDFIKNKSSFFKSETRISNHSNFILIN